MLLGNKCDMEDKRMISKERGEQVCSLTYKINLKYFAVYRIGHAIVALDLYYMIGIILYSIYQNL